MIDTRTATPSASGDHLDRPQPQGNVDQPFSRGNSAYVPDSRLGLARICEVDLSQDKELHAAVGPTCYGIYCHATSDFPPAHEIVYLPIDATIVGVF